MKKSEIELGKVYAYSTRQNPTNLWQINAITITDLDPKLGWADTKGSVAGNYVKSDGEISASAKFLPRYIIGDYQEIKHQFEIREKNQEIARLKKEIERKKAQEALTKYKEIFTNQDTYKIHTYYIKDNYEGKIHLELTHDQFSSIAIDLRRYNQILEEERIKREASWAEQNKLQEEQVA